MTVRQTIPVPGVPGLDVQPVDLVDGRTAWCLRIVGTDARIDDLGWATAEEAAQVARAVWARLPIAVQTALLGADWPAVVRLRRAIQAAGAHLWRSAAFRTVTAIEPGRGLRDRSKPRG